MSRFDEQIDRKNTDSVKWDSIEETYQATDLLPLWVADMDFLAPSPVIKAFEEYSKKGLFGYSIIPNSLYQAVIDWQKRRHHYLLEKADILFSSGVVPSIALAVQSYTNEGDSVLIHDPVYHPFAAVVKENNRNLVRSSLTTENGHFQMDLAEMEQLIVAHAVKLFILCNPHNPGGRVWSKEELLAVGKLCQKHGVTVVSDEIHQDLVFAPHTFTSFQLVDPSFEAFSIVLTAATKTFNLAAIKNSMVFIKDPTLREQFQETQKRTMHGEINTFGYIGTEAAYNQGEAWLEELLPYLQENIQFVESYLAEHLPAVGVMSPEGTYLMWLDFSSFGLTDTELQTHFIEKAKVVLNSGIIFGSKGTGHMRLNIACPRATLEEGLARIVHSFN
ncbi:aminotransferase class I/II [Enterococcus sp. JM4C]|uniref:MalY/PatB family protein n=1 Tax=Candidatus Enterococcus huntleyi TaxID=1857217 RepID=UPI001379C420|nr:MalY/PatB family protein [Enterococcus sp. JM4C]KAF1298308.1 aminotransferase class I/II [Enterococcus sp. JM4C]